MLQDLENKQPPPQLSFMAQLWKAPRTWIPLFSSWSHPLAANTNEKFKHKSVTVLLWILWALPPCLNLSWPSHGCSCGVSINGIMPTKILGYWMHSSVGRTCVRERLSWVGSAQELQRLNLNPRGGIQTLLSICLAQCLFPPYSRDEMSCPPTFLFSFLPEYIPALLSLRPWPTIPSYFPIFISSLSFSVLPQPANRLGSLLF